MVVASGGFSAFPAFAGSADAAKKPELSSKTADSVTLKTEEGYEYARKTVDDAGNAAWSWAKGEQYNTEKKTVTFKGLSAETTYKFACRPKGAEADTDIGVLEVTTDAAPAPDTKAPETNNTEYGTPASTEPETKPAETTEPETKDPATTDSMTPNRPVVTPGTPGHQSNGALKAPSLATPPTNGETNTTDPQNTEDGKNGTQDTQNPGNGEPKTNAPTSGDPGTAATTPGDPATTTTTPGAPNTTATVPGDPATTTTTPGDPTAQQPAAAPAAPEVESRTDTEVKLKAADLQEYAIKPADGAAYQWQNSPVFTGLTPATDYNFVTRIKGTATQPASEISKPTAVKTKAAAAAAPAAPEVSSTTDTSIQLKTLTNQEYAMVTANGAEGWNTAGTFNNLTPGTEYTFVTRTVYNDNDAMPSQNSEPMKASTKLAAAAAPAAPEMTARTDTSIDLKAVDNQEYAIGTGDGNWKWQSSSQFTGLNPGTRYQFITRVKFDPARAMESKASEAASYKTIISFAGSAINGVTQDSVYDFNTKLTATAVGNGMDNAAPTDGDTRWIPRTWDWDGKNYRSWSQAPYSVTFILDKAGAYQLTIGFELEEYTGQAWSATGTRKSITVDFTAKKPVYTINATAGKNGKISPAGDISIEQGNSREFTFTPAKGYRIAKVTVDGKAVTVKNNKYTLTNVGTNHKINVTFERDANLTAPKTGDNAPIFILLGLVTLSAIAIVSIIVFQRRQKKNAR